MKRREFLRISTNKQSSEDLQADLRVVADVEPKGTLSRQDAAHLLRRFTMGPTFALIDEFTGITSAEAASKIIGDGRDHLDENKWRLPDGKELNWLDTVEQHPRRTGSVDVRNIIEGRHNNRYTALLQWWLNLMAEEGESQYSLGREKLTLFLAMIWNIEYTYDTEEVMPPPLLYRHNQKLRKLRVGDYKEIALEMTLDGAFLLYQGLNESKGNPGEVPNENYMRELLELFTMGIANIDEEIPIYTENDIKEGSRVLTGWRVPAHQGEVRPNGYFETYFAPQFHDLGGKNVMKGTIPPRDELDNTEFKVREEEVKGLINIIFTQKAVEISEFICEKIFLEFIYSDPNSLDRSFISQMAEVFRNSEFKLSSVYEFIIQTDYFYDDSLIGAMIQNPVEFVIGTERALGIDYGNSRINDVNRLEMRLYDPPNVSGWTGYRTWISTSTYPERALIFERILGKMKTDELIAFGEATGQMNNFKSMVENIYNLILPKPIKDDRLNPMIQFVKDQFSFQSDGEWSSIVQNDRNKASEAIKSAIGLVGIMPDINLS
ncbi:MAG: hypothetical protein Kapaf2KO_04090 [Candidatus Kapaibacteriales bacterium]